MRKKIGPAFDTADVTILPDGTRICGVWVNGKAPLNGGGNGVIPLGRNIGRVWSQGDYGWVAAPLRLNDGLADSWSDEINRSVRHFRTRKDACVFLYGVAHGIGSVKLTATLASLPCPIGTGA